VLRIRIWDPMLFSAQDPGWEKIQIRDPGKTSRIRNTGFTANNCRLNPPIGEEVRYTDQEYEDSSDGEREGVTAPGHRVHRTR
jgi:hypothetical protein